MAELTEVFGRDEEAEESLPNGEGPSQSPRLLVGGTNFRRSTANSAISFAHLDSLDDEVVFPPPPPPRGEPIHCSSLVIPRGVMPSHIEGESSSLASHQQQHHQRHSLPDTHHLMENNRSYPPVAHHLDSAGRSQHNRRISASSDEVPGMSGSSATFRSSGQSPEDDDDDDDNGSFLSGISPLTTRQRRAVSAGLSIGADLFSKLKPVSMRPGERSLSTTVRLRRQGFKTARSGRINFAVKSIRRGSDEWHNLIKPFVSDLAFRSL